MRDKILRMELYGKFEDESLIKEVLASFTVRVENTLNYYRTKLLGKVPEDYNDLPTDWKDYNFSDLFSQEEASILITTEHVFIMLSISGT